MTELCPPVASREAIFAVAHTLDEYALISTSAARPLGSIPLLTQKAPVQFQMKALGGYNWSRLGHETLRVTRSLEAGGATPATKHGLAGTVLTVNGPTAICAGLLAGYLGYALRVADTGIEQDITRELRPNSPLVVVALSEQLTDALLFGLLGEFERGLASDSPWEMIPRFTLVTARDLASLSRLVARIAAKARRWARPDDLLRLAHFTSDVESVRALELLLKTREGLQYEQTSAQTNPGTDDLLLSLATPSGATAYCTHGVESCARGDNTIVLCGRRNNLQPTSRKDKGILACGKGHHCPRGELPRALQELPAEILFMAACSSLRLADGSLVKDFNLALSFLDGEGVAYVGSVMANSGNDVCSQVFLAALASGRDLAEATALANCLLHAANIDRPVFLAVGTPCFALLQRLPVDEKVIRREPDCNYVEADFENMCFGELLVDDEELVRLAQEGQLITSSSSDLSGQVIYGFHRAERAQYPLRNGNDSIPHLALRLFIFRFPEALGKVRVEFHNLSSSRRQAARALEGLQHWTELGRWLGLAQSEPETASNFYYAQAEAGEAIATSLSQLRRNGSAFRSLQDQRDLLLRLSLTAREWVLNDLLPRLDGSFWLNNIFGKEHYYARSTPTTCPYCGGKAFRKWFRHALKDEARITEVCARCTITADYLERGDIEGISIRTVEIIEAGRELDVEVLIKLSRPDEELTLRVYPRVSSPGSTKVIPPFEYFEQTIKGGVGTVNFKLPIPARTLPHYHFIKLVVASTEELAFAARKIFVC